MHPPKKTTGKNWKSIKTAFRPHAAVSGTSRWEKRAQERKHLETVKAKEREMKEEKEAVRQVCLDTSLPSLLRCSILPNCNRGPTETNQSAEGETGEEGGEGALRTTG